MKEKDIVKRIAEAPAQALDEIVEQGGKVAGKVITKKPLKRAQSFWHILGPGLTTGAADDDPSGIATYSQTGAQYGFSLLWLSLFTLPLMSLVQEMCARIGLVTGKGLAANIREHYSRRILVACTILLLVANIFNLGADLGAMAQGFQLIVPSANFTVLLVLFTLLSLALQIFTTYERYAHYLKYLALILLLYVFAALSINGLDWGHIIKSTLIPHLDGSREQILIICAILGTTISPYLFFWQTSQEVEEEILHKQQHVPTPPQSKQIKQMRIDVISGMLLSNVIMFFIIVACGGTLFASGTVINTAADAASALRPIAGEAAYTLFALGIIGTGFLAVPVLAGSGAYAMAESFKWPFGLYRKLKNAHAFYGVIIIAMLVGFLMNFVGLDPIRALIYSAVANGIVAPVVLVFIVQLSGNKKIMGRHANRPLVTGIGWGVVGVMAISAVAAIASIWL